MGPRDPLEFSRQFRLVVSVATLSITCVALALGGCSRVRGSQANAQSNETPAAKPRAETGGKPNLPDCPGGDSDRLIEGSQDTGAHKVILTWIASVPSTSNGEKVGYCLYRREWNPVEPSKMNTKDNTKKKSPCRQCEQVNVTPVMDTTCVDEIVKNDTTYYYAAIAINKGGQFSGLSTQAPAKIPGGKEPPKSDSSSLYRSCRQWDTPKQTPGVGSQNH